ncbi:hypothetical protein VULLAG_LOCUS23625 [Vulpes lagopus]
MTCRKPEGAECLQKCLEHLALGPGCHRNAGRGQPLQPAWGEVRLTQAHTTPLALGPKPTWRSTQIKWAGSNLSS